MPGILTQCLFKHENLQFLYSHKPLSPESLSAAVLGACTSPHGCPQEPALQLTWSLGRGLAVLRGRVTGTLGGGLRVPSAFGLLWSHWQGLWVL